MIIKSAKPLIFCLLSNRQMLVLCHPHMLQRLRRALNEKTAIFTMPPLAPGGSASPKTEISPPKAKMDPKT